MKTLTPLDKKGKKIVLVLDADEANADWIRSARLLKGGLEEDKLELAKRLNTKMYTQE